jgi:hypothetical protein
MKHSVSLFLLIIIPTLSLAQNPYKKKVVSYVPTVLVQAGCGLETSHKEYISHAVANDTSLARFNCAAIPNAVIRNFNAAVSHLPNVSVENVRSIIEQTLAPELLKILDINKELLSKQNLSESERNTFLATKAQAAGLSADQLQAVLNSGYFYVPYVEYYHHVIEHKEREIKNSDGKVTGKKKYTEYTHEIKIGVLWYKLNVDAANTTTISFVAAANGWQDNAIERRVSQDDDEKGNADRSAFEDAVNVSAVNIGLETKKIEEFKLTGDVQEITTFGIKFNLGRREGIGLDDSYWVEEMQETESGNVVKVRRGFVKVREVGNNTADESAESYAQVITGSNYSPGLSITEIPLLGINGVIGFGKLPITISTFDNSSTEFGLSKYDFGITVNSEVDGAYGPMLDIQADLANVTGIPEFWFNLGGAVGFLNVDGKFYLQSFTDGNYSGIDSSNNVGVSLTGHLHAGLLKKFYFRRFGLLFQGDVKYALTHFSAKGKDENGDNLDYAMTHHALGFDVRAGMEIYLTPTFSIGGGAEYSGVPWDNLWSVSVTDKNKNETKNDSATGPDIRYQGLGWFFWINYSLPSLK